MRRPLSVLLVHLSDRDGGAERQTAALGAGLVERGHKTLVLIRRKSPLERRARQASSPVFPLQPRFPSGPGGVLTWWSRARARELVRRGAWDLIHFADAGTHAAAGSLLAGARGAPPHERIVVTYRGAGGAGRIPATLRRHQVAGGLVSPASEALWAALVRDGFEEERLSVIHPGIDVKAFAAGANERAQAREKLGAGRGEELVGTIGVMDRDRGIGDLIDAFGEVAASRPAARLVIFGDGPGRAALEARARRSPPPVKVRFAGWREDLPALLAGLDTYVFPGAGHEIFPHSLIEAMAASVPVVVRDQPGIREIIENGKQGLFVPGNEPADLARTILRVLAERDEAARIAHAGMVRVQRFHTQAMIDATEALYYRAAKIREAA